MIVTSRHLSRRNFQLFHSQSTVNSQQSTSCLSATGIDISLKLTPMGSAVPLPQNNRPSEDVTIARLIFGKPNCRFLISGNG